MIEAITMKTDHIDIMCTVPNSENREFKDCIVSKEKMAELLVCDDEDIENLLLQKLPFTFNITAKDSDCNSHNTLTFDNQF